MKQYLTLNEEASMEAEKLVVQCSTHLTGLFKKLLKEAGAKIERSGVHPYQLDGHLFYVTEFELICPDLTPNELRKLLQSYVLGLVHSIKVGGDPSPRRSNQANAVAKLPSCPSIR